MCSGEIGRRRLGMEHVGGHAWEIAICPRGRKKPELSVSNLTERPTFSFFELNLGYLVEGGVFSLPIFILGNPKIKF